MFIMERNPIVTIEMENGAIMKIELYPEIAPNTVNNFISLVPFHLLSLHGTLFHQPAADVLYCFPSFIPFHIYLRLSQIVIALSFLAT